MNNLLFDTHAVMRIQQRRLRVEDVEMVALAGITVQENKNHLMKRGEINGQAIHVVILKPNNIIHTVYKANQWESETKVYRKYRPDRVKQREMALQA